MTAVVASHPPADTLRSDVSLLSRVLRYRQLHGAAQLFALPDYDILAQLYTTMAQLKEIVAGADYADNATDQSVVELVLSRVTAAIRDSGCIETYAAALVDMLETCLPPNGPPNRQLAQRENGSGGPYYKIALELLSTLFLYHSRRSVMTLAIPAAVRALSAGGRATDAAELVRHTTSYLSLAAIHNIRGLAHHSVQIIAHVLNGNWALIGVLPQLYQESCREPFYAHLAALLRLLHEPDTQVAERLCLLQLASLVTNTDPDLIVPYLAEFDDFLLSGTTCTAVLHIHLSLISVGRTNRLVGRLPALRRAAHHGPPSSLPTVAKVVAVIGRQSAALAAVTVPDLLALFQRAANTNGDSLPILLKEVEGVLELYPDVARSHTATLRALGRRDSNNGAVFQRSNSLDPTESQALSRCETAPTHPFDTISGRFIDSAESLAIPSPAQALHKISTASSNFPSDPYLAPAADPEPVRLPMEGAAELDRNMRSSADAYRLARANRSLASLSMTANWNAWCPADAGPPRPTTQPQPPTQPILLRTKFGGASQDLISFSEEPHAATTAIRRMTEPRRQHDTSVGPGGQLDDDFDDQMLARIPFQMGRDGRVRPVSAYKNINVADWLAKMTAGINLTTIARLADSTTVMANSHAETTFPVSEPTVRRGRASSGSASRLFVDEHQSAKHSLRSSATAVEPTRSVSHGSVPPAEDWNERGDLVKQFVENRRSKILRYVAEFLLKYPIPSRCTIESAAGRGRGDKPHLHVHFACEAIDAECCVFDGHRTYFNFPTKRPAVWLHLMFLRAEARSVERCAGVVLSQQSTEFRALDACWRELAPRQRSFTMLVTSAFPGVKEQSQLLKELQAARFFDLFGFNATTGHWTCFGCAHPERVRAILSRAHADAVLLEGRLKEQRGGSTRWRLFRRWRFKYFTLSGAALTSTVASAQCTTAADQLMIEPSLDLRKIRSIQSVGRGLRSRKSLPRAFELFTDDNKSIVLKADDRKKAKEWFQCLQIAVVHAQKQDVLQRPTSAETGHLLMII